MDQLTVPQEIERLSKCYGCSGTTFVSFIAFNKKLIETKTVRGFNNIMDSVLLLQQKSIYDIIEKNSKFKKDKFYFTTIAVRYEYVDGEDNKLIERIDSLGGCCYVLQKSKIDIRFNTNLIPINSVPKNIDECLIQLDSLLTNETKDKIRTWDKEYYDNKISYELRKWIDNNWEISCGLTTYPEQEKYGLEKYFYNLGITEPCYIISIITNCYYLHLTGGRVNFTEEIKYYIEKQKNE